ncbi:amidohydrolase [Nocardioides euryhalodurans]|uniref:Amidohydrolase n=1 Tax=Nocardioides euryhalodurans TaxID=2518370 RepID=A0A4P7GM69_9ACTN|nr:amidohydrolase family protein [Nocardioides euryhalodurans]QBR93103.1 amidohydrolase [Nocardioides euryhalodurans]
MTSFLLRRARLVDVDGAGGPGEPVDVRVTAGVVTAVGADVADPGLPEVDADGRWLMPGLWDHHVHLAQWTLASARLDLAGARSADQAVALVRERLAEWPDLPVIGWGHRPTAWPEEPVVSMLDAIGTDQPIILIAGDGHHAWLNSTALMMLAMPLREGVVAEAEWFRAYGRLASVLGDDGTGPEAYRRTMEAAAELGVVGLTDFEFSGGHEEWAERWVAGAGLLRIRMATYADGLDGVIGAGLRTGDLLPGCDDRARMGPLKIISDGSLNTKTAWCCDPYAGPSPLGFPHGHPNQTPEELRGLLRRATRHGLSVAVHAIGDRAVGDALDAFAETAAHGSIEHAQLVRREDVRRMAELGVTASVQPAHLLDDRDVSERLWPGRGDRCFALRWMIDDGVRLALGSDAPVARLDPWLAMAAAVHRTADDREAWHPEQAITPREALAASTDGLGTVAAGHPADLVLLDSDPLSPRADPAEEAKHLLATSVHATWVAGELVHGSL